MAIIGSKKGWANLKAKPKPRAKLMQCYDKRDRRVSNLGYASYSAYLESEDWQRIRDNVLRRHPLCLGCNRPASQVHHMRYDTTVLLGLIPQMLACVCESCHKAIEFDGDTKLEVAFANRKLIVLAKSHPRGAMWVTSMERRGLITTDGFVEKLTPKLLRSLGIDSRRK